MKITVRFAGIYRSLAGVTSVQVDLDEGATVEDALRKLDTMLDRRFHEIFFAEATTNSTPAFLLLVDAQISDRHLVLDEGKVLAIVPPMAGG